jgi:hypothetical protein
MRVLIIMLYSNGDILLSTPIAKDIKDRFPNSHITWLVAKGFESVLYENIYIDQIESLEGIVKGNYKLIQSKKNKFIRENIFDRVFDIQTIGKNQGNYDGCTRSAIFNSYPYKIFDITPILNLNVLEKENVHEFLKKHNINNYKNKILFEFAPQSGQSNLTEEFCINISKIIIENIENTCVIMSSPFKIPSNINGVFDASDLSLRENAELINNCNLFLGTSSGISWIAQSSYCKPINMIQLVKNDYLFTNIISIDRTIFNLPKNDLIEIHINSNENFILEVVNSSILNFKNARQKYCVSFKPNFVTTSKIVYDAICYFQYKSLFRHVYLNILKHGFNIDFVVQFFKGIIFTPYYFIHNKLRKY